MVGAVEQHDGDEHASEYDGEPRNSFRRQRECPDERTDRDQGNRGPMVERPRDHALVVLRLTIEPVIELVELPRDPRLLVMLLVRIRPVGRQHRVERE
jgi:hypothetical protein